MGEKATRRTRRLRDRRERERDVDQLAILPETFSLKMLRDFPLPHVRQQLPESIMVSGWDQPSARLADDLFGTIAENPLARDRPKLRPLDK